MSQETYDNEGDDRPFFRALFDINFTSWITLRVAGILYIFSVISGGLVLFFIFGIWARTAGDMGAIIVVILFPLSFFLLTLTLRLIFEAAVATVAIAKNTSRIRDYPPNEPNSDATNHGKDSGPVSGNTPASSWPSGNTSASSWPSGKETDVQKWERF